MTTSHHTHVIAKAARRNPIGAACATLLAIAFYAVPTWGMYQDVGWWATLAVPALLAAIGVMSAAFNFVANI